MISAVSSSPFGNLVLTRRVPYLQQKENSALFTIQIALNHKFGYCFSLLTIILFRSVSREKSRHTLQEAVHQKMTKNPYEKGTYQQGYEKNPIVIFLKKENVSTTYIFEKQTLKILVSNFRLFIVSKALIRQIITFIIFEKRATFPLPTCVACRTFSHHLHYANSAGGNFNC